MKHQLSQATIETSRQLRRDMTDAEAKVWRMLREHFSDWHFRRQVPIGPYFADFVSHRARLVIEIDGGQHCEEVDANRTAASGSQGYRITRFWNHEVHGNLEGVHQIIDRALDHPTQAEIGSPAGEPSFPHPSPSRGGGF